MEAGTYVQAAAAGADVIGSGIASAMNVHETRQNRRFQRDEAATAHQREVKDLIAAGLNPMLSATHGGAPSLPGGAPHIDMPTVSDKVSNITQNQLTAAQVADLNSSRALKDAQAGDLRATQFERLSLLRNQASQALEAAKKTGGVDTDKVRQDITYLTQQLEKLRIETESSALDQKKKRYEGRIFDIKGKALESVKPEGVIDWTKKKAKAAWQKGKTWLDLETRKHDGKTGRW